MLAIGNGKDAAPSLFGDLTTTQEQSRERVASFVLTRGWTLTWRFVERRTQRSALLLLGPGDGGRSRFVVGRTVSIATTASTSRGGDADIGRLATSWKRRGLHPLEVTLIHAHLAPDHLASEVARMTCRVEAATVENLEEERARRAANGYAFGRHDRNASHMAGAEKMGHLSYTRQMLSLYLVRHGQTDYSANNRFCGSVDPPLNDIGHAMAAALGARYGAGPVAGEPWSAIYTSPLLRARQTAEPTARGAHIGLTIDDGLREIAYGEWEGRPEADVQRDDPERFAAWSAHPGSIAPPGGESGYEIAARALAALGRIRATHQHGKVLVVSHKATLRVLVCALLGIDVDLFRVRVAQKTCAVSIIDFKSSGPLLQMLGDTSHLPPELLAGDGT